MTDPIIVRQTIHSRTGSRVLVRIAHPTGEISEAGMIRVEYEPDELGRMGWIDPADLD